ncbi:MAG: hypothetical protein WAM04_18205 [Candidatus Sulfotelmatobacter sp.]
MVHFFYLLDQVLAPFTLLSADGARAIQTTLIRITVVVPAALNAAA